MKRISKIKILLRKKLVFWMNKMLFLIITIYKFLKKINF